MKVLRKFLSLILVVLMAFSVPPNAFALGETDVLVVGTPNARARFLNIFSETSEAGGEFEIEFPDERVENYWCHIRDKRDEKNKITLLLESAGLPELEEPKSTKIHRFFTSKKCNSLPDNTANIDVSFRRAGEISVVIVAVNADKESDKVKKDIKDLVDKIWTIKSNRTQILVALCAMDAGDFAKVNELANYTANLESEKLGEGRPSGETGQCLDSCKLWPGIPDVQNFWKKVKESIEKSRGYKTYDQGFCLFRPFCF